MSLSSVIPALKRLSLGLIYLVGYTLLSPHITEDYLLTEDYEVSASESSSFMFLNASELENGQARVPVDIQEGGNTIYKCMLVLL